LTGSKQKGTSFPLDEWEEIEEKAATAGMKPTEWLRKIAREAQPVEAEPVGQPVEAV